MATVVLSCVVTVRLPQYVLSKYERRMTLKYVPCDGFRLQLGIGLYQLENVVYNELEDIFFCRIRVLTSQDLGVLDKVLIGDFFTKTKIE